MGRATVIESDSIVICFHTGAQALAHSSVHIHSHTCARSRREDLCSLLLNDCPSVSFPFFVHGLPFFAPRSVHVQAMRAQFMEQATASAASRFSQDGRVTTTLTVHVAAANNG
jgi:hypothetical protein